MIVRVARADTLEPRGTAHAVQPVPTVVDRGGPFTTDNDSVITLGFVGSSTPATRFLPLCVPGIRVRVGEGEVVVLVECDSIRTGHEVFEFGDTCHSVMNDDDWALADARDASNEVVGLVVKSLERVESDDDGLDFVDQTEHRHDRAVLRLRYEFRE